MVGVWLIWDLVCAIWQFGRRKRKATHGSSAASWYTTLWKCVSYIGRQQIQLAVSDTALINVPDTLSLHDTIKVALIVIDSSISSMKCTQHCSTIAPFHRSKLIDSGQCWLMLTDADWCSNRNQLGFICHSITPEFLRSFLLLSPSTCCHSNVIWSTSAVPVVLLQIYKEKKHANIPIYKYIYK